MILQIIRLIAIRVARLGRRDCSAMKQRFLQLIGYHGLAPKLSLVCSIVDFLSKQGKGNVCVNKGVAGENSFVLRQFWIQVFAQNKVEYFSLC